MGRTTRRMLAWSGRSIYPVAKHEHVQAKKGILCCVFSSASTVAPRDDKLPLAGLWVAFPPTVQPIPTRGLLAGEGVQSCIRASGSRSRGEGEKRGQSDRAYWHRLYRAGEKGWRERCLARADWRCLRFDPKPRNGQTGRKETEGGEEMAVIQTRCLPRSAKQQDQTVLAVCHSWPSPSSRASQPCPSVRPPPRLRLRRACAPSASRARRELLTRGLGKPPARAENFRDSSPTSPQHGGPSASSTPQRSALSRRSRSFLRRGARSANTCVLGLASAPQLILAAGRRPGWRSELAGHVLPESAANIRVLIYIEIYLARVTKLAATQRR
jgi:hypothetical protein